MGLLDLLKRMNNGEFDGGRSDRMTSRYMTSLSIENGIPVRRYEGKSTRFFNGKENERIRGKQEVTRFTTDSEKKEFIKHYGFIGDLFGDDEDARNVSKSFYNHNDIIE